MLGMKSAKTKEKPAEADSSGAALRYCELLELVPQELVVNLVMELDFGCFDYRTEQASATVCGCLFQFCVAFFHIGTEKFCGPIGFAEVVQAV